MVTRREEDGAPTLKCCTLNVVKGPLHRNAFAQPRACTPVAEADVRRQFRRPSSVAATAGARIGMRAGRRARRIHYFQLKYEKAWRKREPGDEPGRQQP